MRVLHEATQKPEIFPPNTLVSNPRNVNGYEGQTFSRMPTSAFEFQRIDKYNSCTNFRSVLLSEAELVT